MKKVNDLPTIFCLTQQDWGTWLDNHHGDSKGVWLKIAKKGGAGYSSVSYSEALDSALCYGWIDGQKASLDDEYWLQKFTPRTPTSKWSKINCEKAMELQGSGKMRPAGIREIERAKADGRWDVAYDSQRTIAIPADFQQELDNNQKAQQFFTTLNSVNRYAILYRIQTAKKPETRASRIRKFIAMLADNQKIYP